MARPRSFSLAELKQLPVADADHAAHLRGRVIRDRPDGACRCLPCSMLSGNPPTARFVVLHSVDDWVDSLDLIDALHPQTLLAYGMNGGDSPVPHGAPVRLRLERQMGYKSMKFVRRLIVADEFDDGGMSGSIQNGWAGTPGFDCSGAGCSVMAPSAVAAPRGATPARRRTRCRCEGCAGPGRRSRTRGGQQVQLEAFHPPARSRGLRAATAVRARCERRTLAAGCATRRVLAGHRLEFVFDEHP